MLKTAASLADNLGDMARPGQTTINFLAAALMVLTLSSLAGSGRALRASMESARTAAEHEISLLRIGHEMNSASDFLTDHIRAFAATQSEEDLRIFWREVEVVDRRGAALATAKSLGAPRSELEQLAEAKRRSDDLIGLETRAMRLVEDALGVAESDMPARVAAFRPDPADAALAAGEKLRRARELVFGSEYWNRKRAIREAIERFIEASRERASSETAAAVKAADRAYGAMILLSLAALVGCAALIVFYYFLSAAPIRRYIAALSGREPGGGIPELEPGGTKELAALAEAYNGLRSERIAAEDALRDSELRLRVHRRLMPLAAMEIDVDSKVVSWNPEAERIFGYSESEALGRDIVELIVPADERAGIRSLIGRIMDGEAVTTNRNRNVAKDGRELVCEWFNTAIVDSRGRGNGWASIVKDVTEQTKEAEEILFESRHDPLTGLLNRRGMDEVLQAERRRSDRLGAPYSTIMLDIDLFKAFNDRYGHECGDLVLRTISKTLRDSIRATDSAGRWGGEEFLVLVAGTGRDGAAALAEKIRERVEGAVAEYGGESFAVTVTAGVAACRCGPETVGDCVRRADEALLAGKSAGRNRVVVAD